MMTSKIAKLVLSLLCFISYCSGDSNNTYYINSSSDLEQYLCNTTWSFQYVVFLLNSSVNFTLYPGNFCQVTTHMIEIRSNFSTELAAITCVHDDKPGIFSQKRRGVVFANSKVTLVRLVFKNCGAYLTTIQDTVITHNLNSSSLHYTSSQAATLVFVYCQVKITQVYIYYSYGFAMIGVNLQNSVLSFMNVSNSTGNSVTGSGLVLHFMNNDDMVNLSNDISYNVSLLHCDFSYNIHFSNLECPLIDYYMYSEDVAPPIVNAAGLTILYTQTHFKSHVQVNDAKFKRNFGTVAGAMLLLHYINDTGVTGSTLIENANFIRNINLGSCHGAGLAFYWYDKSHDNSTEQPLVIRHTTFNHHNRVLLNSTIYVSGVVYIMIMGNPTTDIEIIFENSSFNNNSVSIWNEETGVCILAERHKSARKVLIALKDISSEQNHFTFQYHNLISSVGIFSFYGISSVNITGSAASQSIFKSNIGSVIHAVDSNVYLHGHILFQNNEARNGAAIKSIGHGQVYFEDKVEVMFVNNIAQHSGGALYLYKDTLPSEMKQSVIYVSNHSNISFSGNKASSSGNSIYAYPLYGKKPVDHHWIFNSFKFMNLPNNSLSDVSTKPISLITCKDGGYSYFNSYPGEKHQSLVTAVDKLNQHVWSPIDISIILLDTSWYNYANTKVWLGKQDNSVLKEGQNCTTLNFTIFAQCHNFTNRYIKAIIVLSLPNTPGLRVIKIKIYPCPLGFQLDNFTGKCSCNKALNYLAVYSDSFKFHCNIQDKTITPSQGRPWIGEVTFQGVAKFGASKVCPLRYCQFKKSNQAFQIDKLNNKTLITSNRSIVYLCLYNREDVLCGRCPSNLSVVFGSDECKQCHPGYIALTVSIFLIAGPLLVYLLFALKLTLTTGAFNGIIFYAQAANVGILDLLSVYNGKMGVVTNISIILLSALNIGLGFPLCFYNGMTELWKAALSLLFPLYLLTIVVVLIILSRYSIRISNKIVDSSVQVLVTVVHLSFGKLLGSIINVFTPAKVFTSEQTYHVWYWDGSVEYGSNGHIVLMIITSLVVFPLLLPYILLLLFVKPLRHWRCANEYTRPILEAIHAPYKNNKHYWFVARLLLLIMMYILYSIEPYAHVIYIGIASLLVFFIFGQAMFRPYKSNFINLLDCLFLFNLAFVYITIWYLRYMLVTVYSIVPILLFFMTLFMVLICHVLFITGQLKNLQRKAHVICARISQHHSKKRPCRLPLQNATDSFYGSCDNYREPLLSSS